MMDDGFVIRSGMSVQDLKMLTAHRIHRQHLDHHFNLGDVNNSPSPVRAASLQSSSRPHLAPLPSSANNIMNKSLRLDQNSPFGCQTPPRSSPRDTSMSPIESSRKRMNGVSIDKEFSEEHERIFTTKSGQEVQFNYNVVNAPKC